MLGAQRRLPHVEMAKYRNATQNAKRTAKSSNFAARVAPPPERLNYGLEGVAHTTLGKNESSSQAKSVAKLDGSARLRFSLPYVFCGCGLGAPLPHALWAHEQLCKIWARKTSDPSKFYPSAKKNIIGRASAQRKHSRLLIRCRRLQFHVLLSNPQELS